MKVVMFTKENRVAKVKDLIMIAAAMRMFNVDATCVLSGEVPVDNHLIDMSFLKEGKVTGLFEIVGSPSRTEEAFTRLREVLKSLCVVGTVTGVIVVATEYCPDDEFKIEGRKKDNVLFLKVCL